MRLLSVFLFCLSTSAQYSPPSGGGSGNATTVNGAVPPLQWSNGLLAYYDFHEGLAGIGGSTVNCVKGSACTNLTISGTGGSWSALGYEFPTGSSAGITIPSSLFNASKSIVVVASADNQTFDGYESIIGCNGNNRSMLIWQDSQNIAVFGWSANLVTARALGGGQSGSQWVLGMSRMYSWTRGSSDHLYIDDKEFGYSTNTGGNGSFVDSGNSCMFGAANGDGFNALGGAIYAVIFLNYQASQSDIGQIMQQLKVIENYKAKYGGLEYRDLLITSGNSIMAGHTAAGSTSGDIATAIATLLSPGSGSTTPIDGEIRVLNSAIQGTNTQLIFDTDMSYSQGSLAGGSYIPVYTAASSYRFEVLHHYWIGWEGTNGIGINGYTGAQQISYYRGWAQGAAQTGYTTFLATTPATTGLSSPTQLAALQQANYDVLANWASQYSASGVVDLASIPQLQDPQNLVYSCYNPDGVHLVATCQQTILAPAIRNVIQSRGGVSQYSSIIGGLWCVSSASPAVCNYSYSGYVVVPVGSTNNVIDTAVVTAKSRVILTFDPTISIPSTVCNTTPPATFAPSSKVVGTSFTINVSSAPATNPYCFTFTIPQ